MPDIFQFIWIYPALIIFRILNMSKRTHHAYHSLESELQYGDMYFKIILKVLFREYYILLDFFYYYIPDNNIFQGIDFYTPNLTIFNPRSTVFNDFVFTIN